MINETENKNVDTKTYGINAYRFLLSYTANGYII